MDLLHLSQLHFNKWNSLVKLWITDFTGEIVKPNSLPTTTVRTLGLEKFRRGRSNFDSSFCDRYPDPGAD